VTYFLWNHFVFYARLELTRKHDVVCSNALEFTFIGTIFYLITTFTTGPLFLPDLPTPSQSVKVYCHTLALLIYIIHYSGCSFLQLP